MASLNKVQLIGNLGQDPEIKFTPAGQAVAQLSVATNERWTDKDGNKQERAEWHRVVVWGKTAELCGKYLAKGKPVYVEGRIQTRQWDDKDGNKRYTTEVVAQGVQFLGGGQRREDGPEPSDADGPASGGSRVPDDDIPF